MRHGEIDDQLLRINLDFIRDMNNKLELLEP